MPDLATLLARGPWRGRKPHDPWILTADGMRAMYEHIAKGLDPRDVVTNRRAANRGLFLMRTDGLISFTATTGEKRRWRVVEQTNV